MAESGQFLCLIIDDAEYLLPGAASIAIEQRHALVAENVASPVIAWRQTRQGRWPAYGITATLQRGRPANWQRAVFLAAGAQPVGLVADEVHLLGRTDIQVIPFTPLGPPPTRAGHLFNAAWVDGHKVTFVLDPRGLAELLRGFGEAA